MNEAARKKWTRLLAGAGDRKSSPGKGILSREADNQRPSGDMAEPEEKAEGFKLEPATELLVAEIPLGNRISFEAGARDLTWALRKDD